MFIFLELLLTWDVLRNVWLQTVPCTKPPVLPAMHFPRTDINECSEYKSSSPCGLSAFCMNLEGSYLCQCPHGHVGDPYILCYPEEIECQRDQQCPGNTVCLKDRYQKGVCGCKHPFVREGEYCVRESPRLFRLPLLYIFVTCCSATNGPSRKGRKTKNTLRPVQDRRTGPQFVIDHKKK